MSKKTAGIVALLVAIGIAWWSLFSQLGSNQIDTGPYSALGEAAARRVAAALNGSGRLVLVDAELGEFKILAPVNAAQIAAFRKAMRRTGVEIAAVEKVRVEAPSMTRNGIFMAPGQLAGLITRHVTADAIVLFAGLSDPGDLPAQSASTRRPKLIVISNYDRFYKSLLQKGQLELAIAPNPENPPSEGPIGKVDEWFEKHYRVGTTENAAQLPD